MAELQRNFHVLHVHQQGGEIVMPTMNANEIEVLLPPGVAEENEINTATRASQASVNEITVNEILESWEDFEGLEPAFVNNLRVSQVSREKSHDDVEALLPPGVK